MLLRLASRALLEGPAHDAATIGQQGCFSHPRALLTGIRLPVLHIQAPELNPGPTCCRGQTDGHH